MERAVGHGLQAAPWEQQAEGAPTAHVRRAAGFMAWSHTDPAHGCPISMTYAAVPALRADPESQPWPRSGSPPSPRRRTTPASGRVAAEARRPRRDGDDREAGRLRRPGQRHRGAADVGGGRVHAARPQVVHLGADERRLPGAGPGTRRAHLLRACPGCSPTAPATRSTSQRLKDKLGNRSNASAELEFDGTLGAPARRRGSRRPHDHRDGRRDPARLRARLDRADAPHRSTRRPGTSRTARRSAGAHRQAADAERPRRPRASRPRPRPRWRSGWPRRSTPPTTRTRRPSPDRAAAGEVLGLQAHARRSWPRRWSASAATGTSRSPGSPCSTARRR